MGLSTVHGIVKQHDGWIEALSECGVGTSFRVYFPVCDEVPATSIPQTAAVAGSVKGQTVLLVEDDADVRALARSVLEEASVRVIEASDGPSALAMWQTHRDAIDLLITDMVMPGGLTGLELADRISLECSTLPVIFSTGYSVNLYSEDRQFRKDVNYLPKPYLSHELTSIVSSVLTKRKNTFGGTGNDGANSSRAQDRRVA
jgi:CheY-like chemotaxis protein